MQKITIQFHSDLANPQEVLKNIVHDLNERGVFGFSAVYENEVWEFDEDVGASYPETLDYMEEAG